MSARNSDRYIILLTIAVFIYWLFLSYRCGSTPPAQLQIFENPKIMGPKFNLNNYRIKTYKGEISLDEANEKVFKQFGYDIVIPSLPVPTLKYIKEPTCEETFSEWVRISNEPQPEFPPKMPSPELKDKYLLNGYTAVTYQYHDDKNAVGGEKPKNWDKLSELMTWKPDKLADMAYGLDGLSVYNAMKAHRLDNLSGFVVGSMQPWVEIFAILNGAKNILTVEYNKLEIQPEFQDRMQSILPIDFAKSWSKYAGTFDFAATFSSIEHSGIGRYGDPIDPIGDLREVQKIWCMLKKGGLLFLGMPIGTDAVVFNLHRIYGSLRLAMMFTGFEWVDTYDGLTEAAFDLNTNTLHKSGKFQHVQQTVVLRKV